MGDAWKRLCKDRGYELQHTLGEGAYSKVKLAVSARLGGNVAIKCIDSRMASKDFVKNFLPRELMTLPLLRHENIARVYEILEASNGYIFIVMEAAGNGDLLRYVQRRGALPENEIKKYFWQLCQAINYCHSKNICHRDLKCENLLLDKNNKLLVIDFGFSKPILFDSKGNVQLSKTFCGSAAYAAPEIIQGRPYDPRMHDMWSMGVVLYIMACGHMPFDDSNLKKMLKEQLRHRVRFPSSAVDNISFKLKSLIRQLIQPDVAQRATLGQVFTHPFFAGYREELAKRVSGSGSISVARQIFDFFTGRKTYVSQSDECVNGDESLCICSRSIRKTDESHKGEEDEENARRKNGQRRKKPRLKSSEYVAVYQRKARVSHCRKHAAPQPKRRRQSER